MSEEKISNISHEQKDKILAELISEESIVIQKSLLNLFGGDFTKAAVCGKLIYWASKNEWGEFYKSSKELAQELCTTESKVKYSMDKIIELGLFDKILGIISDTPYYQINLDFLCNKLTIK